MTPTEEAAYLRKLAEEVAADTRLGRNARLVTAAVLTGRADRLTRQEKA